MKSKAKQPAISARIPRPEYPRPQFVRKDWINLNGPWTFTFDPGHSGVERGFPARQGFDRTIQVPFCPESKLSGVGHTDFIDRMWYHRTIEIPRRWSGMKVLLHFGAVDFLCEAFVDGKCAGIHTGGSASFVLDITRLAKPCHVHQLVLHVQDELRSGTQPCGKQSGLLNSYSCFYTRVTGIWQTVWMEAVDPYGLDTIHIVPDLDGAQFAIVPRYHAVARGMTLRARLLDGTHCIREVTVPAAQLVPVVLHAGRKPKLWSPASPFLYDLLFDVFDSRGNAIDSVQSYAGLRKVHIEGSQVFLNNEPIYHRLVLDQGFYPDGIWTAPTDQALRRDIELAQQAGFNGARLHQKVFEERFHYWADKLGYLTWGESASWGLSFGNGYATPENAQTPFEAGGLNFLTEWREILVRDRNHPSIIAWSPFNETGGRPAPKFYERMIRAIYALTRDLDPTRPVNDASGFIHVMTDLWTVHTYEQDPTKLKELLTPGATGVWRNCPKEEPEYAGQPYLVDEFGGMRWAPQKKRKKQASGWGYGAGPRDLEEFYSRLEGQVKALLSHNHIAGYCYTQLTDVEQEQNGIYFYDRTPKFDTQRIALIFREESTKSRSAL